MKRYCPLCKRKESIETLGILFDSKVYNKCTIEYKCNKCNHRFNITTNQNNNFIHTEVNNSFVYVLTKDKNSNVIMRHCVYAAHVIEYMENHIRLLLNDWNGYMDEEDVSQTKRIWYSLEEVKEMQFFKYKALMDDNGAMLIGDFIKELKLEIFNISIDNIFQKLQKEHETWLEKLNKPLKIN